MARQGNYLPIRKKHRWWLVYFWSAGLGLTFAWATGLALGYLAFHDFPSPFRYVPAVIAAVVGIGFVLILLLGSRTLPWHYSRFGPYEFTPAPKGFQPHITMDVTPNRRHDVVQYGVGREGIELRFRAGSRVFLPVSFITGIGPGDWREFVVEHDFPEISSPLIVSQEVGEAILAGLGRTAMQTSPGQFFPRPGSGAPKKS